MLVAMFLRPVLRFTEVYVAEPHDSSDLRTLILGYLSGQPALTPAIVEGIIK